MSNEYTTSTTYTSTTDGSMLYINGQPYGQVVDVHESNGTVGVSVGPYVAEMNGWTTRIEDLPPTTTITLEDLEEMKKEIKENKEMIQMVLGELREANKKLESSYDRRSPIDDLEV